ncbi:hypothetical protein GCM10023192_33140 [Amycolatopsis samaneae]
MGQRVEHGARRDSTGTDRDAEHDGEGEHRHEDEQPGGQRHATMATPDLRAWWAFGHARHGRRRRRGWVITGFRSIVRRAYPNPPFRAPRRGPRPDLRFYTVVRDERYSWKARISMMIPKISA